MSDEVQTTREQREAVIVALVGDHDPKLRYPAWQRWIDTGDEEPRDPTNRYDGPPPRAVRLAALLATREAVAAAAGAAVTDDRLVDTLLDDAWANLPNGAVDGHARAALLSRLASLRAEAATERDRRILAQLALEDIEMRMTSGDPMWSREGVVQCLNRKAGATTACGECHACGAAAYVGELRGEVDALRARAERAERNGDEATVRADRWSAMFGELKRTWDAEMDARAMVRGRLAHAGETFPEFVERMAAERDAARSALAECQKSLAASGRMVDTWHSRAETHRQAADALWAALSRATERGERMREAIWAARGAWGVVASTRAWAAVADAVQGWDARDAACAGGQP